MRIFTAEEDQQAADALAQQRIEDARRAAEDAERARQQAEAIRDGGQG
ncbi:hypothetical protein [Streptomyces capuensis]|nr:hypothetical protein [Streptomyces capuensis]